MQARAVTLRKINRPRWRCVPRGKKKRQRKKEARLTPRDTAADRRDGSCVRHRRPRKAASVARRQTEGKAAVGLCEVLGNGDGNTAALALLLHAVYTLNAAQLQAKDLQIG